LVLFVLYPFVSCLFAVALAGAAAFLFQERRMAKYFVRESARTRNGRFFRMETPWKKVPPKAFQNFGRQVIHCDLAAHDAGACGRLIAGKFISFSCSLSNLAAPRGLCQRRGSLSFLDALPSGHDVGLMAVDEIHQVGGMVGKVPAEIGQAIYDARGRTEVNDFPRDDAVAGHALKVMSQFVARRADLIQSTLDLAEPSGAGA
jgi:hypothetical protein